MNANAWRTKISKQATANFNQNVAKYAVKIFDYFLQSPETGLTVQPDKFETLETIFQVPQKFLSRALVSLSRFGLVTADLDDPIKIVFHRERLDKLKNNAQKASRKMTGKERIQVLAAEGFRCGHCGQIFSTSELEVDHIIPLALGGADAPSNWGALCKIHNRRKKANLVRDSLKYYRGQQVTKSVGVHIADGYLWPNINGKPRIKKRTNDRETHTVQNEQSI